MLITTNLFATNRTIADWKVKEVVLPTTTGELGILPNHTRLLTALDIGVLRIKAENNWIPIVILDGIAEIKDNNLKIIVRQIEELSDITIDVDQAKKELDQVVDALAKSTKQNEKLLNTINLKRALARYQALTFDKSNRI
uniref:ATP synthase epsilon chain, chloroplastic n=1 Tax=Vischeria sp. CAUP Q 202 TaxID=1805947 RepID=A0A1D8RDX2_9STRA|nr:ATP synthase CF1 subunit epsilon [Vischeria punctata]AOW70907.1 ATP synthase CF1 subunit epsilon [Vischeria sp. CAUP Q 202]UTV00912.1 ATP synthase CF1 subunit epsilon [Vischeria punctata]